MMGSSNGESSFNECCMCGDYGLPSLLFKCKHCGFRSQHEYCSDLYPKVESYHLCNWCLSRKEDVREGEPSDCYRGPYGTKKISTYQIKITAVEGGANRPRPSTRRNSNGIGKRIIRRTRSEEISNGGSIIKPVFRNKVRRYKLLDEVSC